LIPLPLRRLPGELVGLYWDSGVVNDVPALAWFLLSSLVPLALGVTALAAVLLGDYAQAQAVATRISNVLPKGAHDEIVSLILRTQHESPLLIAGSIGAMVWISSGAVGVVERSLARQLARPGFGFVLGKLRNLGLAASVTLVIVLMVLAASAGTQVVRRIDSNPTLIRVGLPTVSFVLSVLICAAVYRVLAGGSLRSRAAAAGGLVSAVILQGTPTVTGYYMRYVARRTPLGVFLVLAGILVTCYLAALGLLLGAALTARIELGHELRHPSRHRHSANDHESIELT
jgi:uncharacterized BrkB/YihY/UPF0761 family membrane protein